MELLQRIKDHSLDLALVFAQRSEIAKAELSEEAVIAYSRTLVPTMHMLTMKLFQDGRVRPRVAQDAAQGLTILGSVESALGVALVPAAVQRYASNDVRFIRLTEISSEYTLAIAIAFLADALTPTAQSFITVAHSAVQSPQIQISQSM